ncbi:peptidoglycan D,D-transpeptidase FtsI family protein [Myceligenerans indicum]|uniref:Penicillin-binding protein 2 n=1 Tax=Myceligenerans indicum TaxID=2593663 RepID=A0ABS1LR86_9MICO|nr:penicillin-binding protein 2 [Myceligenerans indicum]MBL0888749.1 penicillin-binding protein 2 [Myceligenerans indicum]
MNTTLRRLSTVVMAMFLVLMVSTTWIQFVQAGELNDNGRNVRKIYRDLGAARGPIVVGEDNVVVSVPIDDAYGRQRVYADGSEDLAKLYAPITGFFAVNGNTAGLERSANDYLSGRADSLWLDQLQNLLTGQEAEGSSVDTTIDPKIQQAAWDALGNYTGAAVALDPRTGAILAMVSKPSYDPNSLAVHSSGEVNETYQGLANTKPQINTDDGSEQFSPYSVLTNRAIDATYPPGSTFKVFTSAAAIESGDFTPDSEVPSPNGYELTNTGTTINNFGGYDCVAGKTKITLADAMRTSCNSSYLWLGGQIGKEGMTDMFKAFRFDESLEVPMGTVAGSYPGLDNTNPDSVDRIELSGMGQGDVKLTPLQVAMMSATVANGGTEMKPYLIKSIRDSELEVVEKTNPSTLANPISSSTADALTGMMIGVVENGSGQNAQIPGVSVAGKTGTAENGGHRQPTLWFTGFAPTDDPQVAIAVVLENGGNSTVDTASGTLAAPIAKKILEAAIG